MNSEYTTNKSTQELKQQVLTDIQRVRDDINELKNRMTPGQIIDDAIFYRRVDRSPAATFDYLKKNPVGASFLTLGTLLLMGDENNRSYEQMAHDRYGDVRTRVSGVMDGARAKISGAKEKVHMAKEKLGNVQDKIQSKLHKDESIPPTVDRVYGVERTSVESAGISEKIDGVKHNLSSNISEGVDSAKAALSSASGTARSKLHSASQSVKAKTGELYESSKNLDPLTYLALGAGLGTITGAAIPVSHKEESAVDSVLQDKVQTFSGELEQAINESINILKNEFIGGMTDFNMKLF